MKICRTCGGRLPLSEFYAHPQMTDGHVNHCKECQKERIRSQRKTDPSVRERDRIRNRSENLTPARKEARRRWRERNRPAIRERSRQSSEEIRANARLANRRYYEKNREAKQQWSIANRDRVREAKRRWSKNNRHKRRAQLQARRAILRGELTRQPCEVCGKTKSEAHHEDYEHPLDVRWLCRKHHAEVHRIPA